MKTETGDDERPTKKACDICDNRDSRRVLAHCWYQPSKGISIKIGNWRDGDIGKPSRQREESWLLSRGCRVQRAYE